MSYSPPCKIHSCNLTYHSPDIWSGYVVHNTICLYLKLITLEMLNYIHVNIFNFPPLAVVPRYNYLKIILTRNNRYSNEAERANYKDTQNWKKNLFFLNYALQVFRVNSEPTQQTLHVDRVLDQCWAGVADGGPTLIQHWVNVQYLLKSYGWYDNNNKATILV